MANKCKCGDTESYNFALNIGLCNPCIGKRLEELKIENGKLNIILYHRENGLSHPDFNAELEISKQSERIKELEAGICPSWMGKEKGCNEAHDVEELKAEKENLKSLLEQLIFIAEKSTTDDSEDTTIELAAKAIKS